MIKEFLPVREFVCCWFPIISEEVLKPLYEAVLSSLIHFQIVVSGLLIVHDIPKEQYLQISTEENIAPCLISHMAEQEIFLGHMSCNSLLGNKHFQGGICVCVWFSLGSDSLPCNKMQSLTVAMLNRYIYLTC